MIGSTLRNFIENASSVSQADSGKDNGGNNAPAALSTDTSSLLAGVGAKICVNNANRTVARYQLGDFKPDLTLKSARSQLLGASLQSWGVFKGRELLGAGEDVPETPAAMVKDFSKNFAAGVLGGLMMHPCCIPFYFLPAEKHKQGLLPNLNAFAAVIKNDKLLLFRGTIPRAISTGTEFGVYFTVKNALKDHIDNPFQLEVASSLPAILGAVPWHQRYIDAMNSKTHHADARSTPATALEGASKATRAPVNCLLSRHQKAFVLFTAINMTELAILDALNNALSNSAGER